MISNVFTALILALIIFSCRDHENIYDMEQCDQAVFFPDYQDIKEVEPHFIVTPDDKIVFSANCNGKFKLIEYHNGHAFEKDSKHDYVFTPLLINGEIAGLYDHNNDEKYRFTSERIDGFLHSRIISSARSSPKGNYLLYIPKTRNELHMIDLTTLEDVLIASPVSKINHICFDPLEKSFLFAQNDRIFLYNLDKKQKEEIHTGLPGEKANLFTTGDKLYFVNNDTTRFFNIYACNLKDRRQKPGLVLALNHDLRLPKQHGQKLFFLLVDAGEYLLYYLDLKTGTVRQLTKKGVVFDYKFYGDKTVFTYSDFTHPKCMKSIDISSGQINTLFGKKQYSGMSCSYIEPGSDRSGAWVFTPPDSVKMKGTVLYIHHGLHSDFSPRWDNLLMGLCLNGYRVISPNYPGSYGYGKFYKNKGLNEALRDLVSWKKHIIKSFDKNPLFCLSVSSGNVLLEFLLLADSKGIRSAVSFIGVPSGQEPEFNCPVLYILGEHDPVVPFKSRKRQLLQAKKGSITIVSYPDEGHGIRKPVNMTDLIEKIVCYYNKPVSN